MIQRTKADILALRGSAFATPLPAFAQERLQGFGRERLEVVDLEGGVLPTIMERLAGQLLADYRLYLAYIESKPQRKAKVRSHKKMFYELRGQRTITSPFDTVLFPLCCVLRSVT